MRLSMLESKQNCFRAPIDEFPAARRVSMSQSSLRDQDMQLPKYLKCLVKVVNPHFTLMISVYFHLVYFTSSRVRLCLSLYLFQRYRVELVGSVGVDLHVLKKYGGGKNMHQFFKGIFSCANVHFGAKTGEVVGEEGDSYFDFSPGSKDRCTIIYIKNAEQIKEHTICEGCGLVAHQLSR